MIFEIPESMQHCIDIGDCDAFAVELMALDPRDREALMPAFRRIVQGGNLWREVGPLLLAGAAILSTPAQVAAWFARPQLRWWNWLHGTYEPVVEVLALRDKAWLGELGNRLAADLRTDGTGHYYLAATLIGMHGLPPPTSDNFVREWTRHGFGPPELRPDRYLVELVPRIFDVDGLGLLLRNPLWRERGEASASAAIMQRLVVLSDEGIIARSVLLDGTVGRLVRGDSPAALRPFVELHRRLDPTSDELAAHVIDYLRMLPSSPAFVVSTAQGALRALDEAGRLGADSLAEASDAVLSRPEKGLVRAQLSWLTSVALRDPSRTGEVVTLLMSATTHPDLGLADQTRSLLTKLGGIAPTKQKSALASVLAPSVAPAQAEVPPPIGSIAELAAEVAAVTRLELLAPGSALQWERLLDGITRLWTAASPGDVVGALSPVDELHPHAPGRALLELTKPATPRVRAADLSPGAGGWAILMARVSELNASLPRMPVPFLLAAPTSPTGHLAAAALVERIEEFERLGVKAWSYDLEQALLRLPRDLNEDALARARQLNSLAGATLADWLARGGLDDPVTTRLPAPKSVQYSMLIEIEDMPTAGPVARALLGWRLPTGHQTPPADMSTPLAMPSHREVVAAHLVGSIAVSAEIGLSTCPPLTFLSDCTGPTGPAVTLALAYGMSANKAEARVSAADALLALEPDVDLVPVGQEVAALARLSKIKLSRVHGVLSDVATAGAPNRAWTVLDAALPVLLRDDATPPRDTARILQLAATIAAQVGIRAQVSGLPELATRGSSGQLVTEARRLHRVLNGGTL